jgi:hypothetical protein
LEGKVAASPGASAAQRYLQNNQKFVDENQAETISLK